MPVTLPIYKILSNYGSQNPGVKTNLYRLLNHGVLKGTGRLLIFPVDQGFEHGPERSFTINPPAYDPHYHYQLAIDGGFSAYVGPLGWLEAGADIFAGQVPLILKLNHNNALMPANSVPNQAMIATVDDALRLGCVGVGMTIYPGSDAFGSMVEEVRDVIARAKAFGLVVVVWSYPRGGDLSSQDETAIDVVTYGAHMAALLGAHIVKVKLPSAHIYCDIARKAYKEQGIDLTTEVLRVRQVVKSCFNGKRLVLFSGGEAKGVDGVLSDARAVAAGGGSGSIIARNCFKRPRDEALAMIGELGKIYTTTPPQE